MSLVTFLLAFIANKTMIYSVNREIWTLQLGVQVVTKRSTFWCKICHFCIEDVGVGDVPLVKFLLAFIANKTMIYSVNREMRL